MAIHFYLSVFLLTSIILSNVNAQNALQEYVIRKDLLQGYKAGEFTVYDKKEKHVYYRIESKYNILQNIKLIAYPSKQEVGRLQAKLKLFLYKAEFSIFDDQSNQWMSGLINQTFKLDSDLLSIQWGDYRITMKKKFNSLTTHFRDSDEGEILAQFRIRPASLFWKRTYDMKIFSNKYPEAIYLLGLAAHAQLK